MAAPREFGLELVLKSHSEDIKNKSDIIVCMIHWRMLRHAFLCVGDVHYTHSIPSELLPMNLGWCNDDGTYLLKYSFKKRLYHCNVSVGPSDILTVKLWGSKYISSVRLETTQVLADDFVLNLQKSLLLSKKIDKDLIERQLMGEEVAGNLTFSDLNTMLNDTDQD